MSLKPSIAGARSTTLLYSLSAFALVSLITLGIFASNGWLPKTDPNTGKKTGWFGKVLPANASSSWNPFAPPLPSPTPQLSKEYIYAGSRLLAVEDANANAIPPADIAIWRPATGVWWVLGTTNSQFVTNGWGIAGDLPVPADFDGDGKTDFSIYRPNTGQWWIQRSSDNQTHVVSFGAPCEIEGKKCDKAIPADMDGDGKSDYVVYQSVDKLWHVLYSSGISPTAVQWGVGADVPVPADFDGDGKADYSVWRPSTGTFYSIDSGTPNSYRTVQQGQSGDKPLPADYDGDGKADHTVWRASTGQWFVRQSSDNQYLPAFSLGQSGDIPVQNDYDGDGKCDKAVFRIESGLYGVWHLVQTANNPTNRTVGWGLSGDIPVPAFYRR